MPQSACARFFRSLLALALLLTLLPLTVQAGSLAGSTPISTLTATLTYTATNTSSSTPPATVTLTSTPTPNLTATRQALHAKVYLPLSVKHTLQRVAWSYTGNLNSARAGHTATLLPNGQVLVAGGNGCCIYGDAYPLNSAELYDSQTGTWSATTNMAYPRGDHTATLLRNGKVLVVGGYTSRYTSLNRAELYDPATGLWTATGSMTYGRQGHTATLLADGQVLVAGGSLGSQGNATIVASAELYDPSTGAWTSTGSMNLHRYEHSATLLQNGQVLVVGGCCGTPSSGYYFNSAELYDPATGIWEYTGSLYHAHYEHTTTLLKDGRVLVAGDIAFRGAELYDPTSGSWSLTDDLSNVRAGLTATLLPDGDVLVTGGSDSSGPGNDAELYHPDTLRWTFAGLLNGDRYGHSATLLSNGQVLITGGFDRLPQGISALSSSELYEP